MSTAEPDYLTAADLLLIPDGDSLNSLTANSWSTPWGWIESSGRPGLLPPFPPSLNRKNSDMCRPRERATNAFPTIRKKSANRMPHSSHAGDFPMRFLPVAIAVSRRTWRSRSFRRTTRTTKSNKRSKDTLPPA